MMFLKEGRGWSDAELFEECRLNFGVRFALGLFNFDDSIPTETTYYNFRSRLHRWWEETGEDIIKLLFDKLTKEQIIEFDINGNKLRMDSTLLGSNIAKYSRYELIHETLRLAYLSSRFQIDNLLLGEDLDVLQEIIGESGQKIVFRSNKTDVETRLLRLGRIIYSIISHFGEETSPQINILRSVFYQHYKIVAEIVSLLPNQILKASNIQSPHDPECDFRNKGSDSVQGYSCNLTETCDPKNPLNLLTNAIVEPASTSDVEFPIPALESSQAIIPQKIETLHTDGGYYSPENVEFYEKNGINHILSGLTGQSSTLKLEYADEGNLKVTCLITNTEIPAIKVEPKKPDTPPKWKIRLENGRWRVIKDAEVKTNILRRLIANYPKKVLNIRNNVESTVNHLKCRMIKKKTRYRGLFNHKIMVDAQCIWINFLRIFIYTTRIKPKMAPVCSNIQTIKEGDSFFVSFFNFLLIFW